MKKIMSILLLVTLFSLATGVAFAVSPETVSDPGTYTGELSYGDNVFEWAETTYGDIDLYEIYMYDGESVEFTLEVPSNCDFDIVFECEYNSANPQAGHEEHVWGSFNEELGGDEELSGEVPHEGKYYISVFTYSGSGEYTLTIDIPEREQGNGDAAPGIPGFPLEAIMLGLALTGFTLMVIKKKPDVIR
jgi:hypothetical protein